MHTNLKYFRQASLPENVNYKIHAANIITLNNPLQILGVYSYIK